MSRRAALRIEPRMLTAEQAAAYLGYETTGVLGNIPVKPIKLAETGPGSQPKYDRCALDAFVDGLSGLIAQAAPAAPATAPANDPKDDPDAAYARWRAARGR